LLRPVTEIKEEPSMFDGPVVVVPKLQIKSEGEADEIQLVESPMKEARDEGVQYEPPGEDEGPMPGG
jgi:hypothetical protein